MLMARAVNRNKIFTTELQLLVVDKNTGSPKQANQHNNLSRMKGCARKQDLPHVCVCGVHWNHPCKDSEQGRMRFLYFS